MPRAYGFVDYGGTEAQRWLDLPTPTPGRGQVLVAVHAAGVNPVDWKVREGHHRGFLRLQMPAVLGREVAGVVVQAGPGVDGVAVGDEVFGPTVGGCGGYAECALMDADELAAKPPSVSFVDAATLPVAAATGYSVVSELGLGAGQSVLILGIGGGVGLAALQLARARGVVVTGTCGATKAAIVRELGASAVEYGNPDRLAQLRLALPGGPDGVIDLVGGDALSDIAAVLPPSCPILTVRDDTSGPNMHPVRNRRTSDMLTELVSRVAAGEFSTNVYRVVRFDDAADALNEVESGHARGKVVIDIGPGR